MAHFFANFHTFIASQVFGLSFIIMSIILVARAPYYRNLIRNMKPSGGTLLLNASYMLLFSLFLISVHNLWVWEPKLIVTVFAWFLLIKAILWLAFPEAMLVYTRKIYGGAGYYIAIAIAVILGIILMSKGFHFFYE